MITSLGNGVFMKIGTITLHLPFNYGNALQQFALHKYLLKQGYDTEILSHWYSKNKEEIRYYHNDLQSSCKRILPFILHCMMFNGVFVQYIREKKINRWMETHIKWSEKEGTDETFPVNEIDHDIVITGSDQIWNPIHATSDYFLLYKFPSHIRKIAYAASLGSDVFPETREPFYKKALADFEAISVRESSAVSILERMGVKSTLVCDPTLLHTREEWIEMLGIKRKQKTENGIMMYFVSPAHRTYWKDVIQVAKGSKKKVHVYVFSHTPMVKCSLVPVKRAVKLFLTNIYIRFRLFFAGVHLHFSADPTEFIQHLSESEGLITDSFHGLMFASIFEKKCNVVIGTDAERIQMSARLRNFIHDFSNPEIMSKTIDINSMKSVKITQQLNDLIQKSKKWLADTLKNN